MTKLEKNILLTIVGGGIVVLSIIYKKQNPIISTFGIGIGIVILLIGYLVINGESPMEKLQREDKINKKISLLSDGISKNKEYDYLYDEDRILKFDKKIGNNYIFLDQNNDVVRIKKENLKDSIK